MLHYTSGVMKKILTVMLMFIVISIPRAFGAEAVDWTPCSNDIKKFECQGAEGDYKTYRCLTKHDNALSKECYAVTMEYERTMGAE